MEKFYSIALIIALVILILCLVGIGILMQYQNAGMKFPVHPNICPDLWKVSADNTTCTPHNNSVNVGNLSDNKSRTLSSNICVNQKWAKDNGINWDGVSNYNGC